MHLLDLGSIGYQVAAAGILLFTVSFLVVVKWWTDWLGRVLAGVLSATSAVLVVTTIRQIWPGLGGGVLVIRAIVFWLFGLAVWSGLATFVWAQFFAPRIKGTRLTRSRTTRMEQVNEKASLADPRHDRDGDLHDRTGGHDR
jgi:MFS family permease